MSKINFLHEPQHVNWGDCAEDIGIIMNNIVQAKPADEDKPCDDNWSKKAPNSLGSMMLQSEKANQYGTGGRSWYIWIDSENQNVE